MLLELESPFLDKRVIVFKQLLALYELNKTLTGTRFNLDKLKLKDRSFSYSTIFLPILILLKFQHVFFSVSVIISNKGSIVLIYY